MNTKNTNIESGVHAGARHSLWNWDQIPHVPRERSTRTQWRKGRTVPFGLVFLVFIATLNFFLFLECVEGFRVPKIGGGSKQRYYKPLLISRITTSSTTISTNQRLDVEPLRSVGDEISSAESIEGNRIDTFDIDSIGDDAAANSNTSNPLLQMNFNASGSIGSLLMQMQKKEAELRALNKSATLLFSEDQALKLDATNSTTKTVSTATTEETEIAATTSQRSDLLSWIRKENGDTSADGKNIRNNDERTKIDDEIAMELDNSVSIRITNSVKDITILEPPEMSRIKLTMGMATTATVTEKEKDAGPNEEMLSSSKKEGRRKKRTSSDDDASMTEDDLPTLSKAEHHDGRIGRDMRHLAVSTASCVDSVEEWQLFCQQSTGGLDPIVECIREGAESIREGSSSPTGIKSARKEESFQVALSAFKVLRDLSALSLDLGAVITDGLLRANAAYKKGGGYTLMDDMCTILRHADDFLGRREARLRCKLYVTQLLLAMTCASDSAVDAIRSTEGLKDVLLVHSSYARKERRRRWLRYPGEKLKSMMLTRRKIRQRFSSTSFDTKQPKKKRRQPFIEAASLQNNLNGRIKGTANQVLAAIGYNEWVPKIPGQKGLR